MFLVLFFFVGGGGVLNQTVVRNPQPEAPIVFRVSCPGNVGSVAWKCLECPTRVLGFIGV